MNPSACEENYSPSDGKMSGISNLPYSCKSRDVGQSVFHCSIPPSTSFIEADECIKSMLNGIDHLNAWCEAGTRTSSNFLSLLKGSAYSASAAQLHGGVKQIQDIASIEMKRLKCNLEANWAQLSRYSDAADKSPVPNVSKDIQIVAQSFFLFIESHFRYYQTVANHLGQFVIVSSEDSQSPTKAFNPVVDNSSAGPRQLPNETKVKVASSSPGLYKQVSSFLSKLSPKSPDSTGSLFYVPLDTKAGSSVSTVQNVHQAGPSNSVVNRAPFNDETNNIAGQSNGHVASQEDLDLVINMLSHSGKPPAMDAIPEHVPLQPQQPPVSGQTAAVGFSPDPGNRFQMFTNPNGLSFGNMLPIDEISRLQNRNPEGLSVEALTQSIKTNTWPFKPHQRPPWATNPSAMQSMFANGDNGDGQQNFTWPLKVEDGFERGMKEGMFGVDSVYPLYDNLGAWTNASFSSWMSTDGSSTNSGFSKVPAVVDSSSCSDESSNGGEVNWSGVGVKPVNRRRHSSVERSSQLLPSGADGKSINQIGQNFGKGSADMKGSVWNTDQPMNHDDRVGHRALSMQWSDPLTNRVLTCWDSGVVDENQVRVLMTLAGQSNSFAPALPGGQLDKTF